MEKNKVNIEHELRSKSAGFIWSMLSTPEGLAKWLSDEVRLNGDLFTFTWGNVWSDHEIRTSAVIDKKKFDYIRFRWCGEEYKDTYWELKMNKSDVTGDFVLMITDFAPRAKRIPWWISGRQISVRLDGLRGFSSFVAFVFLRVRHPVLRGFAALAGILFRAGARGFGMPFTCAFRA